MLLWRPILAEPPIYTARDLDEWATLADVIDANEALDLREAVRKRAMEG